MNCGGNNGYLYFVIELSISSLSMLLALAKGHKQHTHTLAHTHTHVNILRFFFFQYFYHTSVEFHRGLSGFCGGCLSSTDVIHDINGPSSYPGISPAGHGNHFL